MSDLIREEPLIRSGREANYELGKDTGRFWDAGATNVHWVIVGEDQVEAGIRQALDRVTTAGVVVEGNSFLDFVEADFAIICARAGDNRMKSSARRTLERADALYLSTIDDCDKETAIERFEKWRDSLTTELNLDGLMVLTSHDLSNLVANIRERAPLFSSTVAANAGKAPAVPAL